MIPIIYGLVTLILILAFLLLCFWAYSPKRQAVFNAHAAIPLMDELHDRSHQQG